MAIEDDAGGRETFVAVILKALVVLIFLPGLPIGVALNVMGIANRLSGLPGISDGGGLVSGVATLVYMAVLAGVLVGGATATSDNNLPVVGGGDATPTTTPTEVPTPTPTPTETPVTESVGTPTPTATPEPSEAERRQMEIEAFEEDYRQRLDKTFDEPNIQDTQYLATEYVENDDGELVFWVVFWECRNADAQRNQRFTVTTDFVNSIDAHDGAQPDRMRFYGVSDYSYVEDSTAHLTTQEAEAWISGEIDGNTYHRNWIDRRRPATDTENETAYNMVVEDGGEFLADKAWEEEEDEPGGCPGRAEVHPEDQRDDV